MLSDLPRFNAAHRYGIFLFLLGTIFAAAGGFLLSIAAQKYNFQWLYTATIPSSFAHLGVAYLLPAAGFLAAGMLSLARQRHLRLETSASQNPRQRRASTTPTKHTSRIKSLFSVAANRASQWMPDVASLAEWPQVLVTLITGLGSVAYIINVVQQPAVALPEPFALKVLAGILVASGFPLLVLQRIFANFSPDLLPEAPILYWLVRIPLAASVLIAASLAFAAAGFAWTNFINFVIAATVALIGAEFALRAVKTMFVPAPPISERTSVADSSIAGALLRLGVPGIHSFNITVRRQLGIDLSRSWALAFIQRAALPVIAGIILFAWVITGATSLGVDQRGVYEQFGRPIAVYQPGLHLHLPWPLGKVRPIEVGVIHQLPIEFLLPDGSGKIVEEAAEPLVPAEAPPPQSADRLWDDAHPFEGSYLIASEEHGQQSFQLVDVDMAVVYQVGVSDDAARDAAYRVTDNNELIQALAGQILVKYLSQNTLLDLLGKSREFFSSEFREALQKQLDLFSAGLEVLSISIEAIHPPPAAASAYHGVQASEIRAQTAVSTSRGNAAYAEKSGETEAMKITNAAVITAAEAVGKAQTTAVLFGGDRQAYAKDGPAFLLERWLSDLTVAMSKGAAIIVDHRLRGQDIPAIDLRPLAGATDTNAFPLPTDNQTSPGFPSTSRQLEDSDEDQ